jgi:uncharacterized membrane protein
MKSLVRNIVVFLALSVLVAAVYGAIQGETRRQMVRKGVSMFAFLFLGVAAAAVIVYFFNLIFLS